jgi:hypothetical protein
MKLSRKKSGIMEDDGQNDPSLFHFSCGDGVVRQMQSTHFV